MRKVIAILLFAMFAVVGLAPHNAVANGQEKAAVSPKLSRWHGQLMRFDKDKSTMDVRRGTFTKTFSYDSSTKWTNGKKNIDMSKFKEGSDVLVIYTYESGSKVMNATRVDLQKE